MSDMKPDHLCDLLLKLLDMQPATINTPSGTQTVSAPAGFMEHMSLRLPVHAAPFCTYHAAHAHACCQR